MPMTEKIPTASAAAPVLSRHPASRIYRSVRDAVHHAAHGVESIKALAADLDMSPSALSMSTVLSDGENARPFPAEKLADLCAITGNYSPLLTLAEQLGFRCIPCEQAEESVELLERAARIVRGGR